MTQAGMDSNLQPGRAWPGPANTCGFPPQFLASGRYWAEWAHWTAWQDLPEGSGQCLPEFLLLSILTRESLVPTTEEMTHKPQSPAARVTAEQGHPLAGPWREAEVYGCVRCLQQKHLFLELLSGCWTKFPLKLKSTHPSAWWQLSQRPREQRLGQVEWGRAERWWQIKPRVGWSCGHSSTGKAAVLLTRNSLNIFLMLKIDSESSPCGSLEQELDIVSMRMQVQSLASHRGLRIQHWCKLQHRPAVSALIWPLTWEIPYASGATIKRKKKGSVCECIYMINFTKIYNVNYTFKTFYIENNIISWKLS